MREVVFCLLMGLLIIGRIWADMPGIHSMVMEGRVLELAETRQVTFIEQGNITYAAISPNGRYIIYASKAGDNYTNRLSFARATGGSHRVLIDAVQKDATDSVWVLCSEARAVWSPNGAMIAVPAVMVGVNPEPSDRRAILILDITGRTVKVIPLDSGPISSLLWNPASDKLAGLTAGYPRSLVLLDVMDASVTHLTQPALSLSTWSSDGRSLFFTVIVDRKLQLQEAFIDGRPPRTVDDDPRGAVISPDGRYSAGQKDRQLTVYHNLTKDVVTVLHTPFQSFVGWSPNSKMFLCRGGRVVIGGHERSRSLYHLWLTSLETHDINHMCVALDYSSMHQHGSNVSWSSDSMKIAYLSNGRVYVAEFAWRLPTTMEKALAGIPISEEEEQDYMQNVAKDIGLGIIMFRTDHDGESLAEEDFREQIYPYLGRQDLFQRLGSDQEYSYQYMRPSKDEVKNSPHETVVFTMDAGHDWKIAVFADGHVRVIRQD